MPRAAATVFVFLPAVRAPPLLFVVVLVHVVVNRVDARVKGEHVRLPIPFSLSRLRQSTAAP